MSGVCIMIGLIWVAIAIRDAGVRIHKALTGKDYVSDKDELKGKE